MNHQADLVKGGVKIINVHEVNHNRLFWPQTICHVFDGLPEDPRPRMKITPHQASGNRTEGNSFCCGQPQTFPTAPHQEHRLNNRFDRFSSFFLLTYDQ
jgi:hypothetical protein